MPKALTSLLATSSQFFQCCLAKILKYSVQMFLPILVLNLLKTCSAGTTRSYSTEMETEAESHDSEESHAPKVMLSVYPSLPLSPHRGPRAYKQLSFIRSPVNKTEEGTEKNREKELPLLASPVLPSQNLRSTLAEGKPPGTLCLKSSQVGSPPLKVQLTFASRSGQLCPLGLRGQTLRKGRHGRCTAICSPQGTLAQLPHPTPRRGLLQCWVARRPCRSWHLLLALRLPA